RRDQKKDASAIYNLIKQGMDNEELVRRTLTEIERQVSDFYVFEVDRNTVACIALHFFPEAQTAEMACVCVDAKFENQGIGAKLMQYVEAQARSAGSAGVFFLSTPALTYFVVKGGFHPGAPAALPSHPAQPRRK